MRAVLVALTMGIVLSACDQADRLTGDAPTADIADTSADVADSTSDAPDTTADVADSTMDLPADPVVEDVPAAPMHVHAQYDVAYMGGWETKLLIGSLGEGAGVDYTGYCRATPWGAGHMVDVMVATHDGMEVLRFNQLTWDGSLAGCVDCTSAEFSYSGATASGIPCCGDPPYLSSCVVQLQYGEPPASMEFYFECSDMHTGSATITIENGRMLIENCQGL